MKVPVLFIIFNRPDIAFKSFQQIRKYQPEELYIAADGPRLDYENDKELCEKTRTIILDEIDWECNVHKLFRDNNQGCDVSIPEAINWMLNEQEYGLIVEDDCFLHEDFFRLCEESLIRYKDNIRVMYIAAFNPTPNLEKSNQLGFTNECRIWGWATWKRAWRLMDIDTKGWKKYNKFDLIKQYGIFHGLMTWYYWAIAFGKKNQNPWDNRWQFSVLKENGLCLQAYVNLSINCGTTIDGVHYKKSDQNPYAHVSFGGLKYPFILPEDICLSKDKQIMDKKEFIRIRIIGFKKKLIKHLQ